MRAIGTGRFCACRGDKACQNGDNPFNPCPQISFGTRVESMPSVIASRSSLLAVAGLLVLSPGHAHAQWWRSPPVYCDPCADPAEKAKSKKEKPAALAECTAKFAGRRKPGGGYTYY